MEEVKNFNKKGGRINLSLFPNGFSGGEDSSIDVGFSLLIGLNINPKKKNWDTITVDSATDLIKGVGEIINKSVNNVDFKIGNSYCENPFKDKVLFNSKHLRRWKRLLDGNSYMIENQNESFSQKRESNSENLSSSMPLFNNDVLDQVTKTQGNEVLSKYNTFLNENQKKSSKSIDELLAERERIYDKIIQQGEIDAINYKAKNHRYKKSILNNSNSFSSKNSNEWDDNRKDLFVLINSIYQHPQMARYFGLIYDFKIKWSEICSHDYFSLGVKESLVSLTLTNDFSSYFQNEQCFENEDKNIKTITPITTFYLDDFGEDKLKLYHGLKDFGCLKNTEQYKFIFSTESPDHILQQIKLSSDNFSNAINKEDRLAEFSDSKRNVTQGIYIIKSPKKGDSKTIKDDCEIGILGQNIAVVKTKIENKKSVLSSLCKREAIYNVSGKALHINHVEEGWLYNDLAIETTDGDHDPQTICLWTGQNLCVPKLGAHEDQKLGESGERGATAGIDENEEGKIIEQRGYKFSYKLVKGADILLEENYNYKFIIRQVLANGYTLPLRSEKRFELTIEDLIQMKKEDLVHIFGDFSLRNDPINPPTLVSNKEFEKGKEKTTETNSHIVVFESNTKNKRLVFPPIIDFQFAQYLGILSKERLGAKNLRQYIRNGRKIVDRAKLKIPSKTLSKKVLYLSDIRGEELVITPADWFTRYALKKYGLSFDQSVNGFFKYEKENVFKEISAGSIEVTSGDSLNWNIEENNLRITVFEGLQLKFFSQLQYNEEEKNRIYNVSGINKFLTGFNKEFKTKLDAKLLISRNNLPLYAKGEFQVTSAKLRPDKPVINRISKVFRPTLAEDIDKSFFTFSISNSFPYLLTVKEFQLITNYKVINHDTNSKISQSDMRTIKKEWAKKGFQLLNHELPQKAYLKTINQIEKEVFKNNFGFKFNFDGIIKWESFRIEDVLVNFNIGLDFDFKIIYKGEKKCQFYLNDILIKSESNNDVGNYSISETFKFYFIYVWENEALALQIKITSKDLDICYILHNTSLLPYYDLSHRNLGLSKKIEQLLLTEYANKKNTFEFIHENEFFVYRTETNPNLIEKSFQLVASSRFKEFYPSKNPERFISQKSDPKFVTIPNNEEPALPDYQITPLIFHNSVVEKRIDTRKRSMQLMFELDGSIKKGESFALVLSENGEVSPFTCAIGRDLTTYSTRNFADNNTYSEGLLLNRFILGGNVPKYLNKYWAKNSADTNIDNQITNLRIGDNNFKILPLKLYFETKKKKWFAVIALDQESLGKYNSYNPFIKIVATRYVKDSINGNFYSKFTEPKYINVISERSVSIKKIYGKQNYWNIKIINNEQIKLDNTSQKRTKFVVCLREKPTREITGSLVVSSSKTNEESMFHLIKKNEISIKMQKDKILCVYEFETFDNSLSSANVNWLQEEKARLIYVEEFK